MSSARGTGVASPQQASLLIAGVVRNGARRMLGDIVRLRSATAGFGRVRWLIVESDSDDDTCALLERERQRRPGFDFRSLGATRAAYPQRTARIANARNAYLEALANEACYEDVTHVLVADLDGVCTDLTAQALASCFALPQPWSMCAANQGDYYYDVWALRHPHWCPGDAWTTRRALAPLIGEAEADNVALFSRMIHIDSGRAPIEVDSAFGGLALYTRAALRSARYVGLDAQGAECCEHVELHAQMRAAGHRLYIHPGLINARKTRHAGRKKFFRTLRRRVWNFLRNKRG